jgi:hypothetical protein
MTKPRPKQRIRILTVDPSKRIVEGQLRDEVPISVAVWETPSSFRWPKVGEMWSVTYEGSFPVLGQRIQERVEDFKVEDMNEGDMYLDSDKVYDFNGRRLIPVDGEPAHGQTIIYDASKRCFVPTDLP